MPTKKITPVSSGTDEDQWGSLMFEASFAGLPLDVISVADTGGNRLVRHTYPHRDGAELERMGLVPRKTDCKIIFFPITELEEPGFFYGEFMRLATLDQPQRFVHPLTGSYMARVGEIRSRAEAEPRDTIEVECSFEEDTLSPAVFEQHEIATYATVSTSQVKASFDALKDALLGLPAGVGARVRVAQYNARIAALEDAAFAGVKRAESWDPFKKLRDANLELARSLNDLDQAARDLGAHTDVRFFETITAVNGLKLSLRQRWKATQEVAQIITAEVRKPTPLHVIAAQIYGARESDERVTQILQLNDIRNPLRVPEGTIVRLQAPGARLNAGQATIVPSQQTTTVVPSQRAA